MAYIEIHQSLLTHRKTLRMARLLVIDRWAVVGRLQALWTWALDNAPEGDLGADFADVAGEIMGWPDPDQLVAALVAAGFVEQDDTGSYHIHDWWDYAGRLIEKRKENAQRMRNARAAKAEPSVDDRATHVQHTFTARAGATVPNRTVPNRTEPSSPSERENDRREDDGADAPVVVGIVDVTDSSLCSEVAKAARIGIDAKELRNLLERHKHLGRQRLIFEAELAAAWIADPQRNKGKNPRKMSVLFLNNWYAKATQPLPQEEANRGRSAAHTGHSGHTGHSSSSARPTGTYRTREIARDPAIWEQRAAILDERRRLAGFPN